VTAGILTIEVGSTITKVIAFTGDEIVGRADALTTPDDVFEGVSEALACLRATCGIGANDAGEIFASSSAAGGLRMTVHGLTWDLTAEAAKEAALGAGANAKLITAGVISERDRRKIETISPNLIMLAGGVEHGAEETVLENARILAGMDRVDCPVVFAGNVALQEDVQEVFRATGRDVYLAENVYPRYDELNVAPVRAVIQGVFARNLMIAPGMEGLRELSKGSLMPVPAACLKAAELLADAGGDCVVVDVGGATTDVHSVIDSISLDNVDPQIRSRRTVEGDLGVYVSASSVWRLMGRDGAPTPLAAIARTDGEKALSHELAEKAAEVALVRHAGRFVHGAFMPNGHIPVRGRDLRQVGLVVGTGGGLARLEGGLQHLQSALVNHRRGCLLPKHDVEIKIDRDYVMSACGSFAERHAALARKVILRSIGGWAAGERSVT